MIFAKKIDNFRLACLWLFCISITLFSVFRNTLSNDGRIYFLAGKSLNNGLSPWNSESDPFAQYLYGPINAILISILSRSSYEVFLLTIKLVTCLLLFYTLKKITLSVNSALPIYFLCCCTFSFRSNMQYAAIGGIGSLLLILSLQIEPGATKRWSSATKLLLLDFKPHIYWFSIFELRGKKRILEFVSLASISYLIILLVRKDLSIEKWIHTILQRKNGLASDPTIISPIFVLFHNALPMYFLLVINILTVMTVLIVCKKNSVSLEITGLAIYASALITTPYLHTIDTLGLTLLTFVEILRREKIGSAYLILILANCLWSTSFIFSSVIITLVIISLCISKKLSAIRRSILIGSGAIFILYVVFELQGFDAISNWYYAIVLGINIIALFRMKKFKNA